MPGAGSSLSESSVSGFLWPSSSVAEAITSLAIWRSNMAAGPPPEGSKPEARPRRPRGSGVALKLDRHVDAAFPELGDQVVETFEGNGSNSWVSFRASSSRLRSGPRRYRDRPAARG